MKIYNILRKSMKMAKNIWVMRIYLGILCVFIILYFYKYKENLSKIQSILRFEILFPLILLSFLTFLFYVYIHTLAYREQGVRVSYWQIFKVAALSRCGTYVPGKVLFGLNYYIFSRRLNIEADKIGKNFIVNNAILILSGALCSLFAITKIPVFAKHSLIIVPFVILIAIHPKILNRVLATLLSKLRQASLINETSSIITNDNSWNYGKYLKFMGFYCLHWLGIAVRLYLCILIFQSVEIRDFPIVLSAVSLGETIGFLAIFAPAGLGIKEGMGAAVLSQMMPWDIALLAFLVLRITRMIVDISVGMLVSICVVREKNSISQLGNI